MNQSNKYKVYFEQYDQYGYSSNYSWEEREYDCNSYEELIKKYVVILIQTTKYPNRYRDVRAYELKELLLLPDDIDVNKELERLEDENKKYIEDKNIKKDKEKKEQEEREYKYYLELKDKYEKK
jgi:hypothetical protein